MIISERILQVFQWPEKYPIRLLLPTMLAVSVFVHAAGFYLVRTTWPQRGVSMPPPPVAITLYPSGDNSLLLGARDPSWLEPGRFRERMLPSPHITRSHRALEPILPELLPPPVREVPPYWIPALPPLAVRPLPTSLAEKSAPVHLQPVTARFTEGHLGVTDDLLSRLRAVAPAEPPGAPTELLVVLDAAGEVHNVWLLRGCGVAEVDKAAQMAVQRSRFDPPGQMRQGILRVTWGATEVKP